ncbi:hypothetical protein [Streptomyces sp. NPDC006446]|uniref:hypothetical protein n=1 Tax=Streptomyces sp. NPDC006446 TaxID=3154301 RepID=UPI0033B15357
MGAVEIVVVPVSAALVAALGRHFSGPRRAGAARSEGGVQRVEATVLGGCSPDLIKVRQGIPVEPVFHRQEAGECTPHGLPRPEGRRGLARPRLMR